MLRIFFCGENLRRTNRENKSPHCKRRTVLFDYDFSVAEYTRSPSQRLHSWHARSLPRRRRQQQRRRVEFSFACATLRRRTPWWREVRSVFRNTRETVSEIFLRLRGVSRLQHDGRFQLVSAASTHLRRQKPTP